MVDLLNESAIKAEAQSFNTGRAPTNLEVIGSVTGLDAITLGGGAIGGLFNQGSGDPEIDVKPEMLPEQYRYTESLYESNTTQRELDYKIHILDMATNFNDTINRSTMGQWGTAMFVAPVNIVGMMVQPQFVAMKLFTNPTLLKSAAAYSISGGATGLAYGSAYELGRVQSLGENFDIEDSATNVLAFALAGATLSGGLRLTTGAVSSAFDMSTRNLAEDVLKIDSLKHAQQANQVAPIVNQALRASDEATLNSQILTAQTQSGGRVRPIFNFVSETTDGLAAKYISFSQTMVGLVKMSSALTDDFNRNGFSILRGKRLNGGEIDAIKQANLDKLFYLEGLTTRIKKEQAARMYEKSTVNGVADPWRITTNWFTDSKFFTSIPRPLTDILQYKKKVGDSINHLKKSTLMLGGGYEFKLAGQSAGIVGVESVLMNSAVERSAILELNDILQREYSAATGTAGSRYFGMRSPANAVSTFSSGKETSEAWANRVVRDKLLGVAHANPNEQTFSDKFFSYFKEQEQRLTASGQIGQSKSMADTILSIKEKIKMAELELQNPKITPDSMQYRNNRILELKQKVKGLQDDIKYMEEARNLPQLNQEPYFSRIFDPDKIEANRAVLKGILSRNFLNNGMVRVYNVSKAKWEILRINNSVAQADSAADKWIDNFLMERDPLGATAMANLSTSNKLMQRSLHINNSEILDFLVTDPMVILKLYQSRVSPKYHFNRLFEGKSIDEVWSDIEGGLISDGVSRKDIDKFGLNFKSLYFRVVGGVVRDPSSLNQKVANGLKFWAQTTLLGRSGLTAMAEVGTVLARHRLGDNLKVLNATLFSPEFRAKQQLIKTQIGEAHEIGLGSIQARIADDLGTNFRAGVTDRLQGIYFNMSLLGPVTQSLKLQEGMTYIHDLLGIAANIERKTVSKFDLDLWSRFGLTMDDAAQIAKAPIELQNGLRMTDMDNWAAAGISPEVARKWKLAVNQSIGQSIITGGAADRPLFSDGIMYVRKNVAAKVPYLSRLPEDGIMKGYVRVENALLTLPFQFMNWTFGAMNKLQANIAHDGLRNRMAGVVTLLGAGYVVSQLKTPSFVWDKMSDDEKFTSAVEYSGIIGIYGDLAMRGLSLSQQLGADISESPLQPRFSSPPSAAGAAATILGPSISNLSRSANALIDAPNDPMKSLGTGVKLLPFTQAIGWQFVMGMLTAPFK